jgi:hypothetical protein
MANTTILPFAQNIINLSFGDVFVTTGETVRDFTDMISIYPGGLGSGTSYSARVRDGVITYVTQLEDFWCEEENQYLPEDVWGWPVRHEGDTVASLGGRLPDEVREGLEAIGLQVA